MPAYISFQYCKLKLIQNGLEASLFYRLEVSANCLSKIHSDFVNSDKRVIEAFYRALVNDKSTEYKLSKCDEIQNNEIKDIKRYENQPELAQPIAAMNRIVFDLLLATRTIINMHNDEDAIEDALDGTRAPYRSIF